MCAARIAYITRTSIFLRVGTSHPLHDRHRQLCRSAFTSTNRITRTAYRNRPSRVYRTTTTMGSTSLPQDKDGGVLITPRDDVIEICATKSLQQYTGDLLVIALNQQGTTNDNADANGDKKDVPFELNDELKKFDKVVTKGALAELISESKFKGKLASSTDVLRVVGSAVKRIVVYGLGKEDATALGAAQAATFAVQKGKGIETCKAVALYVEKQSPKIVEAMVAGAVEGTYVDERYKHKKEEAKKMPTSIDLIGMPLDEPSYKAAVKRGETIGAGVLTTKELVAAPANSLTPLALAQAARTVAKEARLDIKVLQREECEKLGMGLFLGVTQGSQFEPQFIHMTYKPDDGVVKKKVAIVGKAICFDSGGYNLKVGAGSLIELMKFDMGGSGAVLGAAKVIGTFRPKNVEVHFIAPACENMISDHATHPGDIHVSANGKTVEVINTDAEGRLCLADALVYAENLGNVDYIVDLATLTGAIIVALGNDVAGLWSASDDFADDLLACAKDVGEKMWRMPLVDEYAEQLTSKIADFRNIGAGRAGSSITAALFLREFVKTKNWSHLDIAGTGWSDKKGGATGYGVKTLVRWVESLSEGAK